MTNRLKIAIVTGQFPVISESFIINQILFLKEEGHFVDIFCLGRKNENDLTNISTDVIQLLEKTKVFNWHNLMPSNKIKRIIDVFLILIKSLRCNLFLKFLRTLNPIRFGFSALNCSEFFKTYHSYYFNIEAYDVLHVHFADNAVKLNSQLVNYKGKSIITFHGYDAYKFDAVFYEKIRLINNITYTVNTNFLKLKVEELGFNSEKIQVLPVGLNTDIFVPQKVSLNSFNVLFIGRLIPLKAPLLAIQIVENLLRVSTKDIHLNIIGSGEEYKKCKSYITSKNLEGFVTLHKSKSQMEIRSIMNRSDVFLFPGIIDASGRCETQGLVIQEAQAMELPVIISDVGGMSEGIIPNETGFVVKANAIDRFINVLIKLVEDEDLRTEMGKKGRIFVTKSYDIKSIGQKLLSVYNS